MAFQSMSSLFQSVLSCLPKSTSIASAASWSPMMTSRRSSFISTVCASGIVTCPSRHSREMTNWRGLMRAKSPTVLPMMPSLRTW